jgi:hypothetical protein
VKLGTSFSTSHIRTRRIKDIKVFSKKKTIKNKERERENQKGTGPDVCIRAYGNMHSSHP